MGLTKLSVDKLPPIVSRGVLIDMAVHFLTDVMMENMVYNSAEIKTRAAAQGISIRKGDVVLFHTGWLSLMGVDGAEYLSSQGVVAVGSDTRGLEVTPHEDSNLTFPVHTFLLAKHGIYILENIDTREIAGDKSWEFMFVLDQPRFEGSMQTIINPVAIR